MVLAEFLQHTLIAVLTGYLALTNSIAEHIISSLPENNVSVTVPEHTETIKSEYQQISQLPSSYEYGGSLPDILIRNASYQKASLVESLAEVSTTTHTLDEALVNILCTYSTDEYTRTTTGTGFFVNRNGVILTNAHVAQFLLLETVFKEGASKCVVRTGSPATPAYEVELLYISPFWIQKHANLINDTKPKGTGERDYALLYVKSTVDNTPVPAYLPYLPVHTDLLPLSTVDSEITLGGYPAEKLYSDGASFIPTQKIATTTVAEMFTFGSQYADIFYLRSSSVGEHGVSGGPVINSEGDVIGLISTKGNSEKLGDGSLNAITLSYIHRTIFEETGFSFIQNTGGNLPYRAQIFKEAMVPFLSQMLAKEL